MQIDKEKFDYKLFAKTLPKIVRLYFGLDLEPEKHNDKSFSLFYRHRKMLTVFHRPHRIRFEDLSKLMKDIAETKSSAGLVVSASPQAFSLRLFERRKDCWLPIAVWGRTQINAIVSMNSELLADIVPFRERYPQGGGSYKSVSSGKGGLLWSDIVEFAQLGINIGEKIGQDPADIRERMLYHVDTCFNKAKVQEPTHTEFMGTEGWFHFYSDPDKSYAVQLAIDTMNEVRKVATANPLYRQQEFKVVMGINLIKNLRLIPGRGPLDDDSIITYRLLKKRYKKYDIRATQSAVLNLVDENQQSQWVQYKTLRYYDGRNIKVYGHA